MHMSKSILCGTSLAFALVASPSVNATVFSLGNITNSSATGSFSTAIGSVPFLGTIVFDEADTFNFSLSATSNLLINYNVSAGFNLGSPSSFQLTKSGSPVGSFNLPNPSFLSNGSASFTGLTSGLYSLTFIPSNTFNITAGGTLNLKASNVTAVPEAETNVMMLLGLGIIGFIARRKFS